ncbi:MAG: hypothetical protein SGPRY_000593 [Prymnesium sp.]
MCLQPAPAEAEVENAEPSEEMLRGAEENYIAAREELQATDQQGRTEAAALIRTLEEKVQALEQLRAQAKEAKEKKEAAESHRLELKKAEEENASSRQECVRHFEEGRTETAQLHSILAWNEKVQALERARAEAKKSEREKDEAELHQEALRSELKNAEDEYCAAREKLVGQLKATRAEGQAKAEALICKLEGKAQALEQARAQAKDVIQRRLASQRGEHEALVKALSAAHERTVREKEVAIERLEKLTALGNHSEAGKEKEEMHKLDLLIKGVDMLKQSSHQLAKGMDTLEQSSHQNTRVLASIKDTVDSGFKLATYLAEGETECPLLFVLKQVKDAETFNVQNWLAKTWKLTFVCASSLKRVEPSVTIREPREIVQKLLPAYNYSMRAIKTILKIGRLADEEPFARFFSQLEEATGFLEVVRYLKTNVEQMDSLKEIVDNVAQEATDNEKADCFEMLDDCMEMACKEDLEGSKPEDLQKAGKLSGPAYRRIVELAKKQNVLLDLPMKKMVATGGAVAWVHVDEAEKWQRRGWACADVPIVPEEECMRQAEVEALKSTLRELEEENLALIKSRPQTLAILTENYQAEVRRILARNDTLSSEEKGHERSALIEAFKARVKELEAESIA